MISEVPLGSKVSIALIITGVHDKVALFGLALYFHV